MGTRHLIIVRVDDEIKVAQYGQWDGHPTGQGETIARFFSKIGRDDALLNEFKNKVRALQAITLEESNQQWVDCGADPDSDMVSFSTSDLHRIRYPENSRDTGAIILDIIMYKPNGLKLRLAKIGKSMKSAMDICDAEYAYDIDLDEKTITVWAYGHKYGCYKLNEFSPYRMDDLEFEILACDKSSYPKKPKTTIGDNVRGVNLEITKDDFEDSPEDFKKYMHHDFDEFLKSKKAQLLAEYISSKQKDLK